MDSKRREFKRTLITAALPYANGAIHIGHLAGVYIPADIYARYLRLQEREVLYVCGSDEHGVPITIKAQQQGSTPQAIVDQYHKLIKESFEKFGISFDIYSRTTSEIHRETASDFFKTLYDKGLFLERESEQFYDPKSNQFLADRYIVGTCPRCSNEEAYGDQCESCGSTLSPNELINPRSALSGVTPLLKSTTHWYLPLDRYEKWLKEWILEDHKEWKSNVYGQCKSWLEGGLQPRAVSRDLNWGVPIPIEGAEGKVLYVWFDAPIGYISNTKELLPNDWERWWKDSESRLIHFIGKDNIVFHCIVFPTMLKAYGDNFILPDNVPANEFLNLEGDKISTSRNWAVWLHQYLEDFPGKEDVLRYTLCANAPETKDNDFTWKDFQTRNNSELVGILGNFVNRTLVLTHKYFGGVVPKYTLSDKERELFAQIIKIKEKIEQSLEHFHFREGLKEAINLARLGNKYLTDTQPWAIYKEDSNRVGTILYLSLQICANLTVALDPFLPFTTKKLRKILNIEPQLWSSFGKENLLPTGHKLLKEELLFEKIEDEQIEQQIKKLDQQKEESLSKVQPSIPPLKEECSYDEFTKLDLRSATIIEAEQVKGSDKLLKLTVDSGIDVRVVVSGIAKEYKPEELIGKKVILMANLKPRKIMGIPSNGMLLAATESSGRVRLIAPEKSVENGSVVS